MWNSLPPSAVSSKTTEEFKALMILFRLPIQRCVFKHASVQLLVNSFNVPS